jgi:hypothetical protein
MLDKGMTWIACQYINLPLLERYIAVSSLRIASVALYDHFHFRITKA